MAANKQTDTRRPAAARELLLRRVRCACQTAIVALVATVLASLLSAPAAAAAPDQLIVTAYSGQGTAGVGYPVNPSCLKDGQAGPFDGRFVAPKPQGVALTASGGTTPYGWSIVDGSLPPGLSLNPGTGIVSGTPSQPGTFAFTTQVIDATSPAPMVATTPMTITIAPAFDFAGTTTVTPSVLRPSQRSRLEFTYAAGVCGFPQSGRLVIVVPSGWSAPSLAPTDPGYVSAPGLVSVGTGPGGQVDRFGVTGVGLGPGQAVTVTYGSAALTAPSATGVFAFAATSAVSDVAPAELGAGAPIVTVSDPTVRGSTVGTIAGSPTSIQTGAGGPLTFVFTAGSGGLPASSQIALTVPAGWAVPSVLAGAPGFASVDRPGAHVSVSGRAITITGARLAAGQRLTISYGGAQRLAPASAGLSRFAASERVGRRGPAVHLGSVAVSVVAAPLPVANASTPIPVLIVGLAALALVLLGGLLLARRHLTRARPSPSHRVVAEPHPDPAPLVTVGSVGPERSVVLGIVPHHRAATVIVESRRT